MIAIIPARGGSKRILNKNVKLLNGKPLISYTIEAALSSKSIDRVIVNTDSECIAEEALRYGAEVPFLRPKHLATDEATSADVLIDTINWFKRNEQISIDNFVVLQPTSPLRTSEHIDEAVSLFNQFQCDSVASFCEEQHPIFWNKFLDEDFLISPIFDDSFLSRFSQRKTYKPNGAIYILNTQLLIASGKYYSENSRAYIMDARCSVDIDTPFDWLMVEFFLNYKED